MMSSPHPLSTVRPAGAMPGAVDKQFATLQARCALAGAVLERWRDEAGRPTYTLTRGAVCLSLDSAEAVETWLATSTEDAATWS
ncbi:MAG: hypothetical protein KBC94_23165 [Pseudacidovorax sp.]|uniref:hypothetical protein n=1 Tax=Pseudacidovorax sp. TaxID=1934311 RepID=UPI001B66F71A|nr:hypothetical protein [Pseudacidovorax sp.]MBP6897327.1 hypothetical protein [Pseudacidovorax sp.]